MTATEAILTEADYKAALARVDILMDAAPGSPEEKELDVLVDLIEQYETKNIPMGR
jgi:HTH-type transcriptional regulator/antitoxin HigA